MTDYIAYNIIDPIEQSLASVGIRSANQTGLLVGAAAAGGLWIYQPQSMFIGGKPRPWSLFADAGSEGTPVPWWLAAGVAGWTISLVI